MNTQTNYITGLQLIEMLSPRLQERFIKNTINDRGYCGFVEYLSIQFSSPRQAYVWAFRFEDSTEGFDFWEEVYKP
jgi:hypothetical protein